MDTDGKSQRRLQFGLRTALAAMLLLGVGLGVWCDRAARLRKAVAALEALGAQVYWDGDKGPENLYRIRLESPKTPAGLGWLGPEYLHDPTSVVLQREAPFAQTVPHLQSLPKLQAIYFSGDEQAAEKAFGSLLGVQVFAIRHGRCGDLFLHPLRDTASP